MAIQVRQMLVSPSKYNIKAPYSMNAEYLTFHNTFNDASANNEVKNMINNNEEVSFHFAVDDIEVVQGVPADRSCWHTGDSKNGDGNRKSIGIEVCYSKSGGERYQKAEALAIKFIAQLLKERGWGVDRVRTHKSWTEIGMKKGWSSYVKNCPHRVLDEGRWQQVLNAIQNELNILNGNGGGSVASQPTVGQTDKVLYQIKVNDGVNELNIRNGDSFTSSVSRTTKQGEEHLVFEEKNGMYRVSASEWVTASSKYVSTVVDFTKPPTPIVKFIQAGGFAGDALKDVHNYLLSTGHGFQTKKGGDGSILFLIGQFDINLQNYKDCKGFLDSRGYENKLLSPEEAAEWTK